jgi:hypothetical protein
MKTKNALDEDLYNFAKQGDHFSCIEAIKAGADVNSKHGSGEWTALHVAAHWGFATICSELIKSGALLDARNDRGETPLYISADNSRHDICEVLLKSGANVNARTNYAWGPIEKPARNGLKVYGAFANFPEKSQKTCLLLLAHGSDAPQGESWEKINGMDMKTLSMRQAALMGGLTERLGTLMAEGPGTHGKDDEQSLIKLALDHNLPNIAAFVQSRMAMQSIEPIESLMAKIKDGSIRNDPSYSPLGESASSEQTAKPQRLKFNFKQGAGSTQAAMDLSAAQAAKEVALAVAPVGARRMNFRKAA